jgi:hypothetical protein
MGSLVPYSDVDRWDLVPEIEVHCRAEDARGVLLELVVETGLQVLVDAETYNPKLAEMRYESVPLKLE